MVGRALAWLAVGLGISASVALGLLLAALAWRGMWVQSCEGDVSLPQIASDRR